MAEDQIFLSAVCHIEAASPGGQRFNPQQTDHDRRSVENLILLCPNHHKLTDDVERYPPDTLHSMKRNHENQVRGWGKQADMSAGQGGIASSRLPRGAETLVGREMELQNLENAWQAASTHLVSIVAWGGVGKTSLVKEWTARLAARDWQKVEQYFDWSFYSQGTRDQSSATADLFIARALEHTGDPDPQSGSPHDRGDRLSKLLALKPALLVLDGLEPLQYGPGPVEGQLKDAALRALLKGIAHRPFPGLCVVTTRQPIKDLRDFHGKTVEEWNLGHLSEEAGGQLLHNAGARRAGFAVIEPEDPELRKASREVDGHALTLQLLGGYLDLAHHGDVRRRDRVRFHRADRTVHGGHASRVFDAYVGLLASDISEDSSEERTMSQEEAKRSLAVLRLLGLFDRPADLGSVDALRAEPPITGLTEPLVGLSEEEWNLTISRLARLSLLSRDSVHGPLDSHPLIREYSGRRLQAKSPEAWKAAHRRIYEHLTSVTDPQPETLQDLQPLYQAVRHGCLAGLHQQVFHHLYSPRILRGIGPGGFYSTDQLGAMGADIGALASFFQEPWNRPSANLTQPTQAAILNLVAYRLRALGRLEEAVAPMKKAFEMCLEQETWRQASVNASNLSGLELMLGRMEDAIRHARAGVAYADEAGDALDRFARRLRSAEALLSSGRWEEAEAVVTEAEEIQIRLAPSRRRVYLHSKYLYCDFLLVGPEVLAWKSLLLAGQERRFSRRSASQEAVESTMESVIAQIQRSSRARQELSSDAASMLVIALDDLALGRVALYRAMQRETVKNDSRRLLQEANKHLSTATDNLRQSQRADHLPRGLLARSVLFSLESNDAASHEDLDEAWEIAERGGMVLHQADIHLHRARLFRDTDELKKARDLIEKTGYGRRLGELEDAERAL